MYEYVRYSYMRLYTYIIIGRRERNHTESTSEYLLVVLVKRLEGERRRKAAD